MLKVRVSPDCITESELKELFSRYGTITLIGGIEKGTQNTATASVELSGNESNIQAAVQGLNGTTQGKYRFLEIEPHPLDSSGNTTYGMGENGQPPPGTVEKS